MTSPTPTRAMYRAPGTPQEKGSTSAFSIILTLAMPLVLVALLIIVPPLFARPQTTPPRFQLSGDEVITAHEQLESLRVAQWSTDPDTYDRSSFGKAWTDSARGVAFAGNGCSTRDDILERDLIDVRKDGNCVVVSGTLPIDPYTGETDVAFTRGKDTSMLLQIDHVVALQNAWVSGADRLSVDQRVALANDPINLVAADGPTNGAKGARAADEWMPPFEPVHCFYAASQIQVKAKYDLSVTPQEYKALSEAIEGCVV